MITSKQTASSFELKVYEVVKKIPRGKVATYGMVAEALGKKCARAVGNALAKNPHSFLSKSHDRVPCHRVIRSNGHVGGFMGDKIANQAIKIELLEGEGVEIRNNRINGAKFLIRKDQLKIV